MALILKELSVNERITIFNKAQELNDREGECLTSISRQLDLNLSTVSRWLNGRRSPHGKLHYVTLNPSPQLAWLAGLLIGDGSIRTKKKKNDRYYAVQLQMAKKNRDLIKKSAEIVAGIFGKKPAIYSFKHPLSQESPCGWELCHKQFYEYLAPIWKGNFIVISHLTNVYPSDFLRGLYDADGWITYTPSPPRLHCRIGLTNSDGGLLSIVQRILFQLGFKPCLFLKSTEPRRIKNHIINSKKQCFDLCLSKQEDMLNFSEKINFCSSYKNERLKALCQLIEQRKLQSSV